MTLSESAAHRPDGPLVNYNLALDLEGEKRLHELLRALPAAVYTTDALGRITFYNEAAAALWGCHPKLGSDEWCGSWRLFWPDGTPLPHSECPMAMAIKEKRPINGMEAAAERPDGTRVPFMAFPSPLFDSSGKFVGAVNMLVDITERKRAEEESTLAEQQLRDFLENANMAIHWVGPDGTILWANRSELEMLGYTREEYVGHHIAEFHVDQPVIDDILRRLTNRGTITDYEARLRCKNGSIRYVLINSSVFGKGRQFAHTGCFTRDITERKRADAQALEHEKRLAMELQDTRRLQDISTRLLHEDNIAALYDGVIDAAIKLLHSDMATMQMFDPLKGELRLLGSRGFDPSDVGSFEWVSAGAGTSCAAALRAGQRVVIPDIESSDCVVGTPAHAALRNCGIRAAQSTPLIARSGNLIGMITTHWREPHQPTERELMLIDVLARQAADLIERKQSEAQIAMLAREAEHRAKNMLATVQATVHLTRSDTVDGYKQAIDGRIRALANVHRLFVESRWEGAEIRSLVTEELAPYSSARAARVQISGPNCALEPSIAQAIAIILHELATNAAKYGALSVTDGRVQVEWSCERGGPLVLHWIETDGPAVEPMKYQGFGTRVMDSMIRGQLKGDLQFDWRTEGLVCKITLPMK